MTLSEITRRPITGTLFREVRCQFCGTQATFRGDTIGDVFKHEEDSDWQSSPETVVVSYKQNDGTVIKKSVYSGCCPPCSEADLGTEG